MKKVLLDQNLPRRAAPLLRSMGWDAVHVGDVNLARASDQQIIEWALRQERVCVTRDADFHRLLAVSRASKPSVVRIRLEELTFHETAEILIQVWDRFQDDLDRGAVVTVTPRKFRARRLPLKE